MPTYTTKELVKKRLQISTTGHDEYLDFLINVATRYIDNYTARHFARNDYLGEMVPIWPDQAVLYLQNPPVKSVQKVEVKVGNAWQQLDPAHYEIMQEGNAEPWGLYASLPAGVNTARVDYTGGYVIDWQDPSKHELPADITEVANEIVAALFRRRDAAGKMREANEASSVDWAQDVLDDMHKRILDRYRRPII